MPVCNRMNEKGWLFTQGTLGSMVCCAGSIRNESHSWMNESGMNQEWIHRWEQQPDPSDAASVSPFTERPMLWKSGWWLPLVFPSPQGVIICFSIDVHLSAGLQTVLTLFKIFGPNTEDLCIFPIHVWCWNRKYTEKNKNTTLKTDKYPTKQLLGHYHMTQQFQSWVYIQKQQKHWFENVHGPQCS